jgi:hypothetical protein
MMPEPKVIPLGKCRVEIWESTRFLRTVFEDGLEVPATANHDTASTRLAADLGYPSTWEMSKAHEIAHTLIMCACGYGWSPVLRGVAVRSAGGDKEAIVSKAMSGIEEAVVLDFQRFTQTGQMTPFLFSFAATHRLDIYSLAETLREHTAVGESHATTH